LCAFCAVIALVLFGGSHHALALGLALILPGVALLVKPPKTGLGKWGDLAVLGLLLCLLLAFLPQFYWPTPDWRTDATQAFGIDLPSVLSVQPLISFEAWWLAVAGFAWFYVALQWPINFWGRRWLFFFLSILLAALAAVVVWGNLVGARYPGAEEATAFSFFPNRNQTANFLALGGVATFAYAMEGLRSRTVMPLVGVPASALCLVALVMGVSRAGVLLYFVGLGLWFLMSLRVHSMPRFFKLGLPLVVLAFSFVLVSNERTVQRIMSFASADSQIADEFRVRVYEDTAKMVLDAPISGFGLGSFSAVFPQYRDASANYQRVIHPESDLFWLVSEGGFLALGFAAVFVCAYAWRCRGFSHGASASYRVLALTAVIIFLLHALIDVPAHRPGTVYFAILFAALALPNRDRPSLRLPAWSARCVGGFLCGLGVVWFFAGLFNLPWHSSLRLAKYQQAIRNDVAVGDYQQGIQAADQWLALRPLDWRAYFQRAQLTLSESGDRAQTAADFRRARFVEPILGVVSYEEGKVWLPYDPARAVSAWRETLFREVDDMDWFYTRMLRMAKKSPDAQARMARLSSLDPHYRAFFLSSLRGDELMLELRQDLKTDASLSGFNPQQRKRILLTWVTHGNLGEAESFLTAYGDKLPDAWWLWSLLRKNQADFERAVQLVRENVEVPPVPHVKIDDAVFARLTREYAVAPRDIMKGTALLYFYVEQGSFEKALPILDRLLESEKAPLYLYYWRAECLYQVGEYIESWFSFEEYLEKLWGPL
jgi:tetratricopeptide (TPR) repeat protein